MTAPTTVDERPATAGHAFSCVTCEGSIVGTPTFYVGLPFCCAGCVANGPCLCSYDTDDDLDTAPVPARGRIANLTREPART